MRTTTTLTMIDGVRVVVPDSLEQITPYVLREQQDWFEDEIKFLRRLLQPGQKVIDIGANFGVYALSMARTVGPTGRLWAFEPASSTAQYLAAGIEANGFLHVSLERCALSDRIGSAELSLNPHSELNALLDGSSNDGAHETVAVTTLDDCHSRFNWQDIAFVKIDAEGEEARILKGGARFLAEQSPLVEYEVKAGADLHLELVDEFAAIGYRSYRLVPGLDLLVPFDPAATPDGYLLNLFACKRDRAELLAGSGYLLIQPAASEAAAPPLQQDPLHALRTLPYAQGLATMWAKTTAAGQSADVVEALRLYAVSRDASASAAVRFGSLQTSLRLLEAASKRSPSYLLRLASLARVAQDHGSRSVAVSALQQLCTDILQDQTLNPSEPFLMPLARFDGMPGGSPIGNWVLAGALEAWELLGSFSSLYAGESSRQRLEIIAVLGFGSAEMQRRLRLLEARFRFRVGAHPLVFVPDPLLLPVQFRQEIPVFLRRRHEVIGTTFHGACGEYSGDLPDRLLPAGRSPRATEDPALNRLFRECGSPAALSGLGG